MTKGSAREEGFLRKRAEHNEGVKESMFYVFWALAG